MALCTKKTTKKFMSATFFLTVDRERLLSVFCRIPNVARNINLLAPFKASFRMPPSSELLFEIKSRQNVLIVRAGLSVPSQEMSAKQINVSMMTQYLFQVGNYRHNLGCPPNAFLRSSRHCDASVTDSELHNGSTLWRKFGAIKKYVNNSITPIYIKLLGPDGKPPSGLTTADILHRTRKILYDKEQDEAKARSRNQGTFTKKPFSPTWFPVEWEVFVLFGRASDAPERAFYIE